MRESWKRLVFFQKGAGVLLSGTSPDSKNIDFGGSYSPGPGFVVSALFNFKSRMLDPKHEEAGLLLYLVWLKMEDVIPKLLL
mmetsp:Transcript_50243/g.98503  ORF Transcript_50243/g.98503 Transcript_50243/m.98503 type:complete len:82 (+) Transcript_50243:1009-1254(+)